MGSPFELKMEGGRHFWSNIYFFIGPINELLLTVKKKKNPNHWPFNVEIP
jgi:hypothetical protein